MREFFIAIIGIFITCNSHGMAPTAHDDELLRIGAVDSNYKYINLVYATHFFKTLQTALRSLLPLETDEGVYVTGVEVSPYSTRYIYHINTVYSKEEIANAKIYFNSPNVINTLCSGIFNTKYRIVNNAIFYADYYDFNGNKIESVMLNNSKCS